MGSKSAPTAPDYRGAAEAQGEASQQTTTAQTYANRPTQTTPWGTSTWTPGQTIDPATGQPVTTWNQDITLSPSEQQAFEAQSGIRAGLSTGAQSLIDRATGSFAEPIDRSAFQPYAGTPTVPSYGTAGLPEQGTAPGLPEFYGLPQLDRGAVPTAMGDLPIDTARGTGPQVPGGPVTSDIAQGVGPQVFGSPVSSQFRGQAAPVSANALEGVREFAQGPEVQDITAPTTQYAGLLDPSRSSELSQQQLEASGAYNPEFGETQFARQMSLQGPQMERELASLDTQLRNQGLQPGTEAYDNAMGDLQDQQGEIRSRAAQDAMRLGAEEQQRQFEREYNVRELGGREVQSEFGRSLGAGTFQDQQRQQQFQEGQQREAQRFDSELRAAGFSDSQRAQMVQQKLAANEQQFQQQMDVARFTEGQRTGDLSQQFQSREQMFGQQLASGQFAEAQRGADIQQQLTAEQQLFSQQLAGGQFADSQRAAEVAESLGINAQQYQQMLSSAQLTDEQRASEVYERLAGGEQIFGQQMQQADFQNQLREQQFQENLFSGGQQFSQEMQAANYQNTLRQSQIAEEMQQRGMSLNEINALLYGQQVGMPNLPGFTTAGAADPTQYLSAAGAEGQFATDRYATALSPVNSLIRAAGSF